MKICKSKGFLINVTVLFLIIFFADCIWSGASGDNSIYTVFVSFISLVSLVCLFFVNLGFAVFQSKQRMAHLVMSLLIIIAFCGIFPLCLKWGGNTQRQWFFQKGMQTYNLMVDKVIQNKAMLTDEESRLDDLVGRKGVYGYTNADGSITIRFQGRGNWLRAGYLFYSGSQMTVKPGNTNLYFIPSNNCYKNYHWVHLTNGWYEY
jgi:hypothetical protein